MDVKATAKIKISATNEIVQTLKIYSNCLQFCIDTAWNKRIRNNVKLHPFVYRKLREFGLQSQLAIACIKQACGMIKKSKSKPIINKVSIRYNFPRSASLRNNVLGINTIKGRQRFPINIPECYREYFNSWNICESLLKIDKRGRCFFMFVFSKNIDNVISNDKTLGIDLGINNIAVTSDRKFFNAIKIKKVKNKFRHLRSKLQAKGTRSARRLLQKTSGREKRFMAWINHNISKEIVKDFDGNRIVMENLKGIRKQRRGKTMNYWISNWSFYQLQNFIKYKAARKGIRVDKVSAMYTSKICSKCRNIGTRNKGFFHCHCGFSLNADLNASRNLAKGISYLLKGAVNHPNISNDDTKAGLPELRLSSGITTLVRGVMPHSSAVTGIASDS